MATAQGLPASDWDVIVIGGGPAGSTTATLVAQAGRRVLLVDRETFPRFRIGESLMPATYWTFERLGVLDKLKRAPFVRKHSVQFFSRSGKGSAPFYFSEIDPHESSVTWQVERGPFDQLLLDHAREQGVTVREGANVRDVLLDDGRATGVRVELPDGSVVELTCRVVVDATGQTGLLSRKLGLKETDPVLRHAACFTRFRGARREPGIDEGATLILQTESSKTWFWYIPLSNDVVSVGVVGPIDTLVQAREGGPQAIFDEEAARCPALQQRIAGAEQLERPSVQRDFSYISRRIAGDGWVLAGDAFGFLDPIYSTGVFLAFKSAELAADSIRDAFEHGDFSAARLARHGESYVAGMEAMRKLVYAYYDEGFSIGKFVQRHPDCREPIVHLLVGNVFRVSTDGLFERMSAECELPAARRLASLETTR